MDAKKPSVADLILDPDKTYVIPPYQRGYQWKQDQWQTLVQDIVSKATSSSVEKQHWIGIIITSLSEEQTPQRSYKHKYYDLIDGQQRVMTLRVWLQAVIDHAKDNKLPLIEQDNLQFAEIICQEADKQDFKEILVKGVWRSRWRNYKSDESSLMQCYTYFRWILWLGEDAFIESEPDPLPKRSKSESENSLTIEEQWEKALERRSSTDDDTENSDSQYQTSRSGQINCDSLIKATVNSLSLIELERQEALDEDPAEIFEALNGKRTPLEQFDHVRNYIFTGIKNSQAKKDLYDEEWKHHEVALDLAKLPGRGSSPAETFLYDYLISIGETRYQKSFSKTKTAGHFSRYVKNRTDRDLEAIAKNSLLPNLRSWIAVNKKGESFQVKNKIWQLEIEAKRSLHMMDALSSGPVVPLLIKLVTRHFNGDITAESLHRQMFYIESFLGRKVLRRLALSPLRSEMMNFVGKLSPNFSEDELKNELAAISPTDDEIKEVLIAKTVNKVLKYEELAFLAHPKGLRSKQLLAIFQAIETERGDVLRTNLLESTATEAFSIEHIYPQEPENWRTELRLWAVGQSFMDNRLHTIGNLGVIPKRLNSQLSNLSFHEKTEICRSPQSRFPKLKVNEYWIRDTQKKWLPEDIDRRAEQLINHALKYWKI
jgi:uncharacterized protein with ParB-like and HNH nuclease domain